MASGVDKETSNSRCRVCLAVDVRMHWTLNTRILEVFEKLSSIQLNAEEGRVLTICYICYSQLQRCCRFSDMCHRSEQLLRELLQHGSEAEGMVPTISHNLAVSVLQSFSIVKNSNQGTREIEEITIKKEIEVIEEIDEEKYHVENVIAIDHELVALELTPVDTETKSRRHPEEKLYPCNICDKTFSDNSSLKLHMKSHTGYKLYTCNMCNTTFYDRSNFKTHMRTHSGNELYACNRCNKSFADNSSLILHKKTHPADKPYACNICSKSFSANSTLKAHIRIHTEHNPYTCNICCKSFSSSSALTIHKRIHTGEKPYSCNMCNKSFSISSTLTKHYLKHTGDKPYSCNMCDKSFPSRFNLKSHMMTHTGDRPYSCNICNNSFRNSSNLASHLRTHQRMSSAILDSLDMDITRWSP